MKTALLTVLILAGLTASASDDLICQSVNSGPDHGKILTLSTTNRSASLTEQTIAGPKPIQFGDLDCEFPPPPNPVQPDQQITYAKCWTPQVADAGFNVVVTTGGIVGKTMAQVFELTIMGRKLIDTMLCDTVDHAGSLIQ